MDKDFFGTMAIGLMLVISTLFGFIKEPTVQAGTSDRVTSVTTNSKPARTKEIKKQNTKTCQEKAKQHTKSNQ